MTRTDHTDHDAGRLETLLGEVRQQQEEPSAAFLARLTEAAIAAQPGPKPAPPRARGSSWRGFFDVLGGWPAAGGLTAAAMVGLWIGVAPPEALDRAWTGSQSVELFPATLSLLEEG